MEIYTLFRSCLLNKDVKSTLRAMWDRTIALSPVSTILMFRLETDVLPFVRSGKKWDSILWDGQVPFEP